MASTKLTRKAHSLQKRCLQVQCNRTLHIIMLRYFSLFFVSSFGLWRLNTGYGLKAQKQVLCVLGLYLVLLDIGLMCQSNKSFIQLGSLKDMVWTRNVTDEDQLSYAPLHHCNGKRNELTLDGLQVLDKVLQAKYQPGCWQLSDELQRLEVWRVIQLECLQFQTFFTALWLYLSYSCSAGLVVNTCLSPTQPRCDSPQWHTGWQVVTRLDSWNFLQVLWLLHVELPQT